MGRRDVTMLLGCIADDFTGASDVANTIAKAGMATVQFVGVPHGTDAVDCEAGVVALKTRSVPPRDAVNQSLAALRWLKAQGCAQILFKYCSTFDSTPDGNIGPVAEALADALGAEVAVVCPVFPETGRTLYQGHLFVKDRLLSESGMERHPLTPMTDPDIRRWLSRQTVGDVGLVAHEVVRLGPEAITTALAAEAAAGRRLAVVDAITTDDLRAIGRAVAGHPLVTGGSGIAIGLPANFRNASGGVGTARPRFSPLTGAGIVLSGSCSAASQAQITEYLSRHPGMRIDPSGLLSGELTAEDALSFVAEHRDKEPALYSTATPEVVAGLQRQHGAARVADAIERFFGEVAATLVASGTRRIVVGGGETSGAVVAALGINRFEIGPEIDPGVPALAASTSDGAPIRLALKSGNFGAVDFYAKALRALGTG